MNHESSIFLADNFHLNSKKPKIHSRLPDKMTYLGQRFCMVVYPIEASSSESAEEGEEMKEARSPLSKEDGDNHKSADC